MMMMMQMERSSSRPPYLDEFEKLLVRINTPRVMIDNADCLNATLVMIDSARKDGILLEAVQVLSDLNLLIKKGYVSSDGRWNMDVFHVTNLDGNKLTDNNVITCIQQSLGSNHNTRCKSFDGMTAIEVTGSDRVGLLSEVFEVLYDLKCDVVEAKVWTHNGRMASLIYLKESIVGDSSKKIESMEARLRNVVLKGDNISSVSIIIKASSTHTERRLHQMMSADERLSQPIIKTTSTSSIPIVVCVQNCLEKGYSVLNITCKDRPKLLFDVICTLTDLQYVVFHATIDTTDDNDDHGAYLEFFIRHADGTPISSEAEKQRVTLCLRAAIQRRASQGVRLELCKADKPGLLAELTRTFRENALNVTLAEISTTMGTAMDVFYVTDALGNNVSSKIIESVRQRIGSDYLRVKDLPIASCTKKKNHEKAADDGTLFLSLGSLLRRNLYNLGWIKSYS